MNLLSLPTDHMLANALGILVCLAIMVVCVCRLSVSEAMPMRVTLQQVMLICFALWAAGTVADLYRGADIGVHGAAAGLGVVIYLLLTYREWRLARALQHEAHQRELPQNKRPLWMDEGGERAASSRR